MIASPNAKCSSGQERGYRHPRHNLHGALLRHVLKTPAGALDHF
jgi:hypothetical protein